MSKQGGNLTTQYNLRWSDDLKSRISNSAKEHNRSINQEIVHRLEESFRLHPADALDIDRPIPQSNLVESDLSKRRDLAHIAMISSALENMPTQEFLNLLFKKMNANGLTLTVEEINRIEKKPATKTTDDWT